MSDVEPPDLPAPTKTGLPTWAIVLIVVGAVGLLVVGVGAVATVAVVVPKMQESQRRMSCMNNLSQLGQVYLTESMENAKAAQSYSGAALWLSYRKGGRQIQPGNERVLLCPGDPLAHVPETAQEHAAYESVDLAHAPRALCSYAARDFERFPIDPKSSERQVIGACIHHQGGAVVVYDGGDATFLALDQLGVSSDDEKTVGPDSKSPVLRVVRYGDGSVR